MAKNTIHAQQALEPYCIAAKLRALRMRKRLTLARLSLETGFSAALLSKLETSRMVPTLATLAAISRVYGVGLGHFFCDPEGHALSITRRAHLEGRGPADDATARIPLSAPGERSRLVAEAVEIPAGALFYPEEPGQEVCAFVYVLEGGLEIISGGLADTLEAGDCVSIESGLTSAWASRGKERGRVLLVRPAKSHEQP